jgi:hypothetical protein
VTRRPVLLGGLALVTAVIGAAVQVPVWIHRGDVGELIFTLGFAVLAVAGGITGATVASRVPENGIGWVILLQGLGAGLTLAMNAGALASAPGHDVEAWIGEALATFVAYGLTGVLLLLFPTGRPLSRPWAAYTRFFVVASLTAAVADALQTETVGPEVSNAFRVQQGTAAHVVNALESALSTISLPALVLCAIALVVRLVRSRGLQRQQLKLFTYCATMAGLGLGLAGVTGGVFANVAWVAGMLGMLLLPVAAGLAVLRHGLYDIDVVIKRTLVYGVLTALLVATYVISVLAFRVVLDPLTGTSDLSVAVSTLAVAALFRPLRARVQAVVDRRFFRHQYDATRTLESFTGRLRQQVDLDAVSEDLRSVVDETMQPAHVTLWLRRRS